MFRTVNCGNSRSFQYISGLLQTRVGMRQGTSSGRNFAQQQFQVTRARIGPN